MSMNIQLTALDIAVLGVYVVVFAAAVYYRAKRVPERPKLIYEPRSRFFLDCLHTMVPFLDDVAHTSELFGREGLCRRLKV